MILQDFKLIVYTLLRICRVALNDSVSSGVFPILSRHKKGIKNDRNLARFKAKFVAFGTIPFTISKSEKISPGASDTVQIACAIQLNKVKQFRRLDG